MRAYRSYWGILFILSHIYIQLSSTARGRLFDYQTFIFRLTLFFVLTRAKSAIAQKASDENECFVTRNYCNLQWHLKLYRLLLLSDHSKDSTNRTVFKSINNYEYIKPAIIKLVLKTGLTGIWTRNHSHSSIILLDPAIGRPPFLAGYLRIRFHRIASNYDYEFCNWQTKDWAQRGFEPRTTRTQSEYHTPRPLSHE